MKELPQHIVVNAVTNSALNLMKNIKKKDKMTLGENFLSFFFLL